MKPHEAILHSGILLLLPLALPSCATSPGADEPLSFRVMTYNIHHGEGLDGKLDLARIAALIAQERADLVALQEVDRGVARTDRRDLPAELASLTGMTCVFSNNFAFQGGEYGNAILSRFPVRSATNTHLAMLRPGEQRGVLQVRVAVAGRELVFANTHIDFRPDDAERLRNVEQFRTLLPPPGRDGPPVIFCGDFNDVPTSRTYARMREWLDDAWPLAGEGDGATIPARAPTRRIDYIWVSPGRGLTPKRAWVPASEASDHRPLVVEFELGIRRAAP